MQYSLLTTKIHPPPTQYSFSIFPFLSLQQLVLAQNSTAYDLFIKPPINPQLHIHIFNYTNAQRYLDGLDDKLKVEDVGPYIYTEKTQKVDVVYHDNNTISYRVIRFQQFF